MLLGVVFVPDECLDDVVMLQRPPELALILHLVVELADAKVCGRIIEVTCLCVIHGLVQRGHPEFLHCIWYILFKLWIVANCFKHSTESTFANLFFEGQETIKNLLSIICLFHLDAFVLETMAIWIIIFLLFLLFFCRWLYCLRSNWGRVNRHGKCIQIRRIHIKTVQEIV